MVATHAGERQDNVLLRGPSAAEPVVNVTITTIIITNLTDIIVTDSVSTIIIISPSSSSSSWTSSSHRHHHHYWRHHTTTFTTMFITIAIITTYRANNSLLPDHLIGSTNTALPSVRLKKLRTWNPFAGFGACWDARPGEAPCGNGLGGRLWATCSHPPHQTRAASVDQPLFLGQTDHTWALPSSLSSVSSSLKQGQWPQLFRTSHPGVQTTRQTDIIMGEPWTLNKSWTMP